MEGKMFPTPQRYDKMIYKRTGRSGLKLPVVSLGLWHNFGGVDTIENSRDMIRTAFDVGITHFDLANNYGPPPGSAEETFGRIIKMDLKRYRDELIISTKAGYYMWPGPYGDFGSRKYLISSLDQSLKRMGLDYVDIFYHHRPDLDTPMEETMGALDQILRSGKALYVGISNYDHKQTHKASEILRELGQKCLIHQPSYNMFNRWIEEALINRLEDENMGCIVFSPLAQGLLTNKYLEGIPEDSRASKPHGFLKKEQVTKDKLNKVRQLSTIAEKRNQSLSQLAISWVLRHSVVTSALIGASRKEQILECVEALDNLNLNADELKEIDQILQS
jgi:L-glyceraldehyde 3-phosphate reductase